MGSIGAMLGSMIFKVLGTVAIVVVPILGVMYTVLSIRYDTEVSNHAEDNKTNTAKIGSLQVESATFEAASKANKAEALRLTADLEKARKDGELRAAQIDKARVAAITSFRKLKEEVANVSLAEDRHLGPVGQRGYIGMRELAKARAAAKSGRGSADGEANTAGLPYALY